MPVHAPKLPEVITRENYHYADFVPYYTPNTLNDLKGPTSGSMKVDHNINTSPTATYNLDTPGRMAEMYSATVRDGTQDQQEALLDKAHLMRVWPELNLPTRCRRIWETEFPDLGHDTRKH